MIKNLLLTLLFSAATLSAAPMHATASAASAPAIVPAPLTARFDGTEAMLPREVTVGVDDAALNQSYLLSVLEECGFEPRIVSGRRADIRFVTDKGLARENNERYVLRLDDRGITASAGTTAGLLNALQTLRQVVTADAEGVRYACGEVDDAPRYHWRAYMLDESRLPLLLPGIDKFLPTEQGEPPLGRAKNWETEDHYPLELCTMPGFAGSSAYYLRYMDPHNDAALVSEDADTYWRNVDLYIGGTEHATGHLIYSRFWNKFLFDLGFVCEDEPFKKLVNQGMIQGRSNFVYRIKDTNTFVSYNLKGQYETTPIHVDVNIVSNDVLDIEAFRNWRPDYKNAEFILEDGRYICGWAVEKMSKSMYNVVNPDDIVERYGADTLRLYEMFLGPIEQSKPWDTNGIDGVHRFLKKFWNLFFDGDQLAITDSKPSKEELKSLHKLIKKVSGDIETFSYNTSVSAFMICVNELSALKCRNRHILESIVVLLAPFTPHLSEELWHALGHNTTVCDAQWPAYNEEYLKEDTVNYAVSFNGKVRFNLEFPSESPRDEIEKAVLAHENSAKWLDGKTPKKIIVVPGKLINIVVG